MIDRFRTTAIWRLSVLAGHVAAAMFQTLVAVTVVVAVAVGVGVPSAPARSAGWPRPDAHHDGPGVDLAGRRTGAFHQRFRERQQHPDAVDAAAVASLSGCPFGDPPVPGTDVRARALDGRPAAGSQVRGSGAPEWESSSFA